MTLIITLLSHFTGSAFHVPAWTRSTKKSNPEKDGIIMLQPKLQSSSWEKLDRSKIFSVLKVAVTWPTIVDQLNVKRPTEKTQTVLWHGCGGKGDGN